MKWFKHYTNARKDPKLVKLRRNFGLDGIAMYWFLIEICAEQLLNHSESTFELSFTETASELKKSRKCFKTWLNLCSKYSLLTFKIEDDDLIISFPKILKIMHKDSISSKSRNKKGPLKARLYKDKDKDKDKELDLDKEKEFSFESDLLLFWNNCDALKKHNETPHLLEKLHKRIKKSHSKDSLTTLKGAITNYSIVIKGEGWFKYKWTLEQFLTRDGAMVFWPDQFTPENYVSNKPMQLVDSTEATHHKLMSELDDME